MKEPSQFHSVNWSTGFNPTQVWWQSLQWFCSPGWPRRLGGCGHWGMRRGGQLEGQSQDPEERAGDLTPDREKEQTSQDHCLLILWLSHPWGRGGRSLYLCVRLYLRGSPASRQVLMWPQLPWWCMSKLDICKGVLSPQKTETGTDHPKFLFQAPQQEGPKEHIEWPHFPETLGAHSPGLRIPYWGWRKIKAPSLPSLSLGELISGHATHPKVLPTLQPPLKGLIAQFLKIKARFEPWATSLRALTLEPTEVQPATPTACLGKHRVSWKPRPASASSSPAASPEGPCQVGLPPRQKKRAAAGCSMAHWERPL